MKYLGISTSSDTLDAGIPHQAMNIKAGIRVKERIFHIQNVNAYDSRLKGWMQRFKGWPLGIWIAIGVGGGSTRGIRKMRATRNHG
jgi:hypothetical protein